MHNFSRSSFLPNFIIRNNDNYLYLNKNLEESLDWNKLFPPISSKLIGENNQLKRKMKKKKNKKK